MNVRKKLAALGCVVGLAILPAVTSVATASAAPTGVVSNGIAWTTHPEPLKWYHNFKPSGDYCTMSVVGVDDSGNKVAISAAHCISAEPDGAVVRRWVPWGNFRQPIGEIAYRNLELDYVVIDLYDDAVLSSNGPGVRIDHLGPANPTGVVCKDGQTTGVTCGAVTSQTSTRIYNVTIMGPGDSGGPLIQNDGWVGINRALDIGGVDGDPESGIEYVKAAAVIADIESRPAGTIGQGLEITNS